MIKLNKINGRGPTEEELMQDVIDHERECGERSVQQILDDDPEFPDWLKRERETRHGAACASNERPCATRRASDDNACDHYP